MACSGVMRPEAMGRLFVRSTLASRSRSQRSFTVQPAPLSSSAPAPKSASSLASGSTPGGPASAMDQKQGHARSHVPAGAPDQAMQGARCLRWARQIRPPLHAEHQGVPMAALGEHVRRTGAKSIVGCETV